MKWKWTISALLLSLASCATYRDVKEIRMIGFSEDLSKGKSVGRIESNDCVFKVMGYALGNPPELSRAIANARTQQKSQITDAVVSQGDKGAAIRYATNVTTKYSGFDAWVVGRSCIEVKGVGYL